MPALEAGAAMRVGSNPTSPTKNMETYPSGEGDSLLNC